MNYFNFYSPTEFVFGKGRENECGEYVVKQGGFVALSSEDIAAIYRIAANAKL